MHELTRAAGSDTSACPVDAFRGMRNPLAVHRVVYDEDGRPRDHVFVHVNDAFEVLTGLDRDEIVGRSVREALTEKGVADADWTAVYARTTDVTAAHFTGFFEQGGRWHQVDTYSPCRECFVAIFTDFTDAMDTLEVVQQARDYYERIFDDFPAMIWRTDTDGRCDYFNRAWLELRGRTLDEESGDGWREGVHPDDLGRVVEAWHSAIAREDHFEVDYRLRRKDGAYRWLSARGTPFYSPHGELLGYIGACHDISQRVEHTAQLRELLGELAEREHLLDESQRVAAIGSYGYDVGHDRWQSSPVLDEIFGIGSDYPRTAEGWVSLAPPADRPDLRGYLERLISERERFDRSYRIVRKSDGELRWVHGRGDFVEDGGGLRLVGTIQDVTEQHRAQEALRRRDAMLRAAEEVGDVGSWEREVGADDVAVSDHLLAILGLPAETEFSVRLFLSLVHPDDREAVTRRLQRNPGEPRQARYRVVRPDGSIKHLSTSVELMPDADGRLREVGMIADVTEQTLAEQELQAYQSQLKALTVNQADTAQRERRALAIKLHDRVSQPLAAARLRVQLLANTHPGGAGDDHRVLLRLIDEAIEESRTITTELGPPLLYELGLLPAIEWLCERFEEDFGLRCEIVSAGDVHVETETAAIAFRVVRELLANVARHAGVDRARVEVEPGPEGLTIRVADEGRGFGEAASAGFGLMSVREVVEASSGTLHVDSAEGRGTVVTLGLPAL